MWHRIGAAIAAGTIATGGLWTYGYSKHPRSMDDFREQKVAFASDVANDSHGLQNYRSVESRTKKFKLLYVSVFARHGARTPNYFMNSKFATPGWRGPPNGLVSLIPELKFCTETKLLPDKTHISEEQLNEEFRRITPHSLVGQLTLVGQEQALSFGKHLKKNYKDFLAGPFYEDEIILRSTMFPRTYYTIKGIISGMYGNKFGKCQRPIVYTSLPKNETFYPNPQACSAFKAFIPPGARLIATDNEVIKMKCILREMLGVRKLEELNPSMVAVNSVRQEEDDPCSSFYKKSSDLNKDEGREEVKHTQEATIYSVRDDFHARDVHKFEMPPDWNSYIEEIDRLSSKELLFEYMGDEKNWKDKLSLLVSPVFNYIIADFDGKLIKEEVKKASCAPGIFDSLDKEKIRKKMQISAIHDSTLMPMMAALGLFKARWPAFMSSLIFELYEDENTNEVFVRTLYNGVPQKLKLDEDDCKPDEYSMMGLICYDKFKKALLSYSVPDEHYLASCDKAAKLFHYNKPVLKDQFDPRH